MALDTDYSVQFEARPHHFSLGGIYEPVVTHTCITTSEQSLVLKCFKLTDQNNSRKW